jgi:hypothetical protein
MTKSRSELPVQRAAPYQVHHKTIPDTDEQLSLRMLIVDAILVGLVVMLVVAIAML